jgi:molybdate transport system ATP-binding protein
MTRMLEVMVKRKQGDFLVDVAFSVPEKGITALFGPSGVGKTSVVNMIAGLSRPDSGRIVLGGRVIYDAEEGIHVSPDGRGIGYIFQDGRLFPHLTVQGNLVYGMKLVPEDRRYVGLDQVVDLLGIRSLLGRRPAKLSGGEKQRVAIGRAFLCSPALLLMDEPLASLDGPRKEEVLPFIAKICRKFSTPVLYVSHSVSEITRLAHQVVILDNGRVAASGPAEELAAHLRPGGSLP